MGATRVQPQVDDKIDNQVDNHLLAFMGLFMTGNCWTLYCMQVLQWC